MKNRKIIFIAGVLAALGVVKLVSASGDTEVEAIKLYNEDFVVSEVIQTTTTIVSTTTMPVFPTEVVDIDEVNIAIEDGEAFTVEELRYLYGKCGEFHDLALEVGWTEKEWPKLSQVMWKESRCTIDAWNGHDAGLTQINGFWCSKNKYSKAGFLQDNSILSKCEDLFVPEVNLKAALAIYNYSQNKNKCGWRPWSMNCK